MKIGIIGAENSHSAAIAQTINVKKAVDGFTVDYLWGEAEEFVKKTVEKGEIPRVVRSPEEMLGKIEALIVDHRHAKFHLEAARPFLAAGVPMFIDKPFCYRASEGRDFLAQAAARKVPVTSYSTVPLQAKYLDLKKRAGEIGQILGVTSFGPCDPESPYGGVFFYGIHQVEMVLEMCGYDVASALITRNGESSVGQLFYESGLTATMFFFRTKHIKFSMTVVGEKGTCHQKIDSDADAYLAGITAFCDMFRSGREPRTHDQILKPIMVLEALERSVKTGKREPVEKQGQQ